MATLRELKGRIGSVASTGKVTSSMKMISSAKMHKSEQALKRLVPFRSQIQTVMGHLLAADGEYSSPLIEVRDVKRLSIVVFGSDDGLCGAYNINIFKDLVKLISDSRSRYGAAVEITICPVGKKMARAVRKLAGDHVSVAEASINTRSSAAAISDFTEDMKNAFLQKSADKVLLLYMHYKTPSRQVLQIDQLLPVSQEAIVAASGSTEGGKAKNDNAPCIFEPDANAIFNAVLPLYVNSVIQEVCTENNASEAAARVMAMQTASDNAQKLLEELQLEYNKLRQQSITTELLDILGGQVER